MGFEKLYPDRIVSSVFDMDWSGLAGHYKGVIFDIDNTLVPHGAPAEKRTVELFEQIHALGIHTMLLSNNGDKRVKPFAAEVNSGYICDAGKPGIRGYQEAMREMGTSAEDTLFVGDQIFTDIWGANRAGMDTVLTAPVDRSTDEIQIVIKRILEKPFRRVRGKRGRA